MPKRNPDNDPVFLVYRSSMKGTFVPSLVFGDQPDGAGKSRLGSVVSVDPNPGDMVHRQRLTDEEAKLSLSELMMRFPAELGKDTR